MVSRILSTVFLWSIVGASLWYFGQHGAVAIVTILSALTLHEFYGLTARMGLRPFRWMGLTFSVLMTAGPFYLAYFVEDPDLAATLGTGLLVLAVVLSCIRVLGERDAASRVETVTATVGGLLYIPFMLQFLVRLLLRDTDNGDNLFLCFWVVAVSKSCDMGALLAGLAIGRHKMAPEISPKKTWEGAVGGVLASSGVGAALAYYAPDYLPESLTPSVAFAIAALLAVTTIISDLIESVLKRRADAKDTGRIIPGIGGAFDLTDSLILTAPVAYFIFLFLE